MQVFLSGKNQSRLYGQSFTVIKGNPEHPPISVSLFELPAWRPCDARPVVS